MVIIFLVVRIVFCFVVTFQKIKVWNRKKLSTSEHRNVIPHWLGKRKKFICPVIASHVTFSCLDCFGVFFSLLYAVGYY